MAAPRVITLDTETYRIEERPAYPPKAVGLAVKWPGEAPRYFAFGHASGNNSTLEDVRRELYRVHLSGLPILFHNGKFDLDVIRLSQIDFPFFESDWRRVHDTMFLAFLCDPHAREHGLKELATTHLNWPADERDEIAQWVWDMRDSLNQLPGYKVNRSQKTKVASNAFEFMPWVPGSLAGKYAVGDVARTEALFERMYAYVEETGMLPAYDRERELRPILQDSERRGIRVDMDLLTAETETYQRAMAFVEDALRRRLGDDSLNLDADQQYAEALLRTGIVREEDMPRTAPSKAHPNGQWSVAKGALTVDKFTDPHFASAMGYRNRLKTCLTMFMEKWLHQGSARGGYVSTSWHQTRGGEGGTRTGRPSTSGEFNLLNIAKSFEGRPDGYVHPDFLGVPKLPLVRRYMLPDEGHKWLHRDFSGQELRVFAHFENGDLMRAYLENPELDPHSWVRDVMVGMIPSLIPAVPGTPEYDDRLAKLRTKVKVTNFQSLYGGGVGAVQRGLKVSRQEAEEFKRFHDTALPGRKKLNEEITKLAKMGHPIRTLGGRLYYVEEPRFDKATGRVQDFYYKLINYLVQGSSADLTKQAIIDWYNHPRRTSRFLVTVYDEINVSCPVDEAPEQMLLLREQMCLPRLDVPMISDGKWGDSWGSLEKCA